MKKVFSNNPDEVREYLKNGYKVKTIGYFQPITDKTVYHFTLIKNK